MYYEDGCAEEFSQWLRIWSGTVSAVMVLAAVFEIYLIVLSYQVCCYTLPSRWEALTL